MYNYQLHQKINNALQENGIRIAGEDNLFYTRFVANAASILTLFTELYGSHPQSENIFAGLIQSIISGYIDRPAWLRQSDEDRQEQGHWFLRNDLTGMSLYVDRFSGHLSGLSQKLDYLKDLGVNLLHLMPLFKSPALESDGGYAVSDFRTIDERFGNLDDLVLLRTKMLGEKMSLMLDIVLNHTSDHHGWAEQARQGDLKYQQYYYMFDDRYIPEQFEGLMPEIFPESAPGNFTYVDEIKKWVMTVFHKYQWDLNYRNPQVFIEMLDTIFFYANLGVDILRIDAPAFIWKQIGTSCQNLPQAHSLLRLIKQSVQVAAPGMALLGEAIVAPSAIMTYFGTGPYTAKECDLAYNATQMALQWDALATGDIKVMLAAQHEILQKPYGCSWITYTRCHDDIGLGYDDYAIQQAGYQPYGHRKFLKDYYSGNFPAAEAKGALFSVNPKTQDARISGSLASLCGLETALAADQADRIEASVKRILLMQAMSFFIGGIPMIFYGDEVGYTNDYTYLADPGKRYDNRWMHRPVIDWHKNQRAARPGTVENQIFAATKKMISIRSKLTAIADNKNITWLSPHNIHVAGYLRSAADQRIYCLFNFGREDAFLTWYAFKEHGKVPARIFDHWTERFHAVGDDKSYLVIKAYSFLIAEPME